MGSSEINLHHIKRYPPHAQRATGSCAVSPRTIWASRSPNPIWGHPSTSAPIVTNNLLGIAVCPSWCSDDSISSPVHRRAELAVAGAKGYAERAQDLAAVTAHGDLRDAAGQVGTCASKFEKHGPTLQIRHPALRSHRSPALCTAQHTAPFKLKGFVSNRRSISYVPYPACPGQEVGINQVDPRSGEGFEDTLDDHGAQQPRVQVITCAATQEHCGAQTVRAGQRQHHLSQSDARRKGA